MTSSLEEMHEAVGRAVLAAQMFEVVFVVCNDLVGMLRRKSGSSLINPNRYKVPTRNLLKELAAANTIASEFADQIDDLVEKRHLLVHRWFQENGLPGETDVNQIAKLVTLANDVETNSKRISALLAGYVVRWSETRPIVQSDIKEEERDRLLKIFQRAHLGRDGS